ncbi:MAG: DNA-directed RNA polymerase subunit omega [Firmicutes bacterium]|nr:DNA-directed RNA polymerase subunit omega [Bacillota bacterium]
MPRRARSLTAGAAPLIDTQGHKPVTIALMEIKDGILRVKLAPSGTK